MQRYMLGNHNMKLLSLSNYVPEQIVDLVRFTGYNGGLFRQPHSCKYVQDFIAKVLEDNSISGAVIPSSCDSIRCVADILSESDKFVYPLKQPSVANKSSQEYFANVIKAYKESVESFFGVKIVIDIIAEKTLELRERGKYLLDIYNSQGISYAECIGQINTMLSEPIIDWRKYAPQPKYSYFSGKRVYIIGPFLEDATVLTRIENSGLQIVGDNLTNSKRLMWGDYEFNKETIYSDISAHILKYQLSPTSNRFSQTWDKDFTEIKRKNVSGVIFYQQKFCEPYNYLFSMYKQRLEDEGIHTICVSAENESASVWESFSEML